MKDKQKNKNFKDTSENLENRTIKILQPLTLQVSGIKCSKADAYKLYRGSLSALAQRNERKASLGELLFFLKVKICTLKRVLSQTNFPHPQMSLAHM